MLQFYSCFEMADQGSKAPDNFSETGSSQYPPYTYRPQSTGPHLNIPGTPSTVSTASSGEQSTPYIIEPASQGQYLSLFSTSSGPSSLYQPSPQPQPLIPFTFEEPRRNRRRRKPSSQTSSSAPKDTAIEAFSFPQPQDYQFVQPVNMASSSRMSKTQREQLANALRQNQFKTLIEIRRVERCIDADDAELREPLRAAWVQFVNSHNLLNELRSLTKNFPFSSECLDEAKWKVVEDPASSRSWNFCWLVLCKVRSDYLITKHSGLMASKPEMWGATRPTASAVGQLATNFSAEWTRALDQLLRQWETAPVIGA